MSNFNLLQILFGLQSLQFMISNYRITVIKRCYFSAGID